MSNLEEVRFKTNVLLKSIIGKDLINNDNIAVLELVKNAYDAGTPRVNVTFKNLKQNDDFVEHNSYSANSSKIVIQDYGNGMSRDDLVNKWLNIAFSEKKVNRFANNRYLAGAKGVGRFSCDRLGKFLDLYTRKANGLIYHLQISWEKFEVDNKQDLTIQDIPLSINTIPAEQFEVQTGYKLFEKGTILEISKLRSIWATFIEKPKSSRWDTEKIIKLKDYLAKLINPNQAYVETSHGFSKKVYEETAFKIFLNAPEFLEEDQDTEKFRRLNGEVDNKIFQDLFFKATAVEGRISDDGKEITTTLNDKGRTIFEIVEKNKAFPLLKNVKVTVLFLNPYAKAYFTRQTGTRSVAFGSIFLFINGFRVSPLGDEGNDWLGLETRKGQGYARFLGTRDLIGRIEITDPNNDYQIISSREGVVRDDRLDQLVTPTAPYDGFFYKILKRLEKYVVDGLLWDRAPEGSNIIYELEKKIKDKTWQYDPNEEVFEHSTLKKNARILESISSIIAVKPDEVKHIYINEALIGQMLEESEEMAFEQVRDVVRQLSRLDPKSVDEATKAILDHLDQIIAEKDSLLKQRESEIEREREERNKLQLKLSNAERQVARVKDEAERLKLESKNKDVQISYFKTTQTLDLDRVINLHHHIKILSHTIDNTVAELSSSIEEGSISVEEMKDALSNISFANQKILTITKFATKANFLLESEKVELDIVSFIVQYIKEVHSELIGKKMQVLFEIPEGFEFKTKFAPLEVSMVIDNFIDNSLKASSSEAVFHFDEEDGKLLIKYEDNGDGLDNSIPKNGENIIFEKGFTTTYGSGLGLHHVSEIIAELKGSINVNRLDPGVEFNIVLEKQ